MRDEGFHALVARFELASAVLFRSRTRWTLSEWMQCLKLCPGREARVLVLHLLHEMTFPEIGERLGFSRGRADQLFRRALKRLKPHLLEQAA